MNKSESKYFNTAIRMDEALISLIEKKDFEYITIKEICETAGVNRSTFYLHYENTRDLLNESLKLMHDRFYSCFSDTNGEFKKRLKACSREELFLITPEYLEPYLKFIDEHRSLYKASIKNPDNFNADETYKMLYCEVFDPILDKFNVPQEEKEYFMKFYLNGISAIISKWLENDCNMPIDKVMKIIIKCIPGSENIN